MSLCAALHISLRGFLKVFMKTIGKFIAYSVYSVTGIFSQEISILGSAIIRAFLSLFWIRSFAFLLFDLKTDLSWIEFLLPSLLTILVCSEWSIAHRERVPEISWIAKLTTTFSSLALTIHLIICTKLLMLSRSNFLDCFLLLWPCFACILSNFKYLSTFSFPRYYARLNLLMDTCFSYVVSSALINCLLLRKGATILILAELCSSALIMIVSVSRLAHQVMLEIRVQLKFQKLTGREIAALADDDLCAVCLEKHTTQSCRLLCSHIVHANCLINVLQSRRPGQESQCPVCRAPIFGDNSQRGANPYSRTSDATTNAGGANTNSSSVSEITPVSSIPQPSAVPPAVSISAREVEEIRRSRPLLIDRIPWRGQTIYLGDPPIITPNLVTPPVIINPVHDQAEDDPQNLQEMEVDLMDAGSSYDVEYLSCLLSDDESTEDEFFAEEYIQSTRKRPASHVVEDEEGTQSSPKRRLVTDELNLASASDIKNT